MKFLSLYVPDVLCVYNKIHCSDALSALSLLLSMCRVINKMTFITVNVVNNYLFVTVKC